MEKAVESIKNLEEFYKSLPDYNFFGKTLSKSELGGRLGIVKIPILQEICTKLTNYGNFEENESLKSLVFSEDISNVKLAIEIALGEDKERFFSDFVEAPKMIALLCKGYRMLEKIDFFESEFEKIGLKKNEYRFVRSEYEINFDIIKEIDLSDGTKRNTGIRVEIKSDFLRDPYENFFHYVTERNGLVYMCRFDENEEVNSREFEFMESIGEIELFCCDYIKKSLLKILLKKNQ